MPLPWSESDAFGSVPKGERHRSRCCHALLCARISSRRKAAVALAANEAKSVEVARHFERKGSKCRVEGEQRERREQVSVPCGL